MISKLDANDLLDVYGGLLTQRQREILGLYYEEDFSYTEISEELEISRAAAMDSVHRATKLLEKYEAAIGYVAILKENGFSYAGKGQWRKLILLEECAEELDRLDRLEIGLTFAKQPAAQKGHDSYV